MPQPRTPEDSLTLADMMIDELVDGIRHDLSQGDSAEQSAMMVRTLYGRDGDQAATLLGAALVRLAMRPDTCPICQQSKGHEDGEWCNAEMSMIMMAEGGDDD